MLNMTTLIEKKKKNQQPFTEAEIAFWVRGAANKTIPDYQLTALLMAIYFQGMTAGETRDLTMQMARSGHVADLSAVGGLCVDKHSTGGVGDTTTLVLTPLTAACGAKVAKMSGRGLGHTGGTLDKLESIPGMRVEFSMDDFIRQVREIGCAVIGQSADLAPADKILYSLRDVTSTVDSMPLIVSSIMSKKIASGAGAIVLDVKTGSGALMHTLDDSIRLAESMVEIGRMSRLPTYALVTGMDQPLGMHIGNALEVKEAIDVLSGRAGGRLLDVSLQLGAMMLVAGRCASTEAEAHERLLDALQSGRGLEKLREMITAQGGDARVVEDTALLPHTKEVHPVPAPRGGYVMAMDTTQLGLASQLLGAGRAVKDDLIDPAVGIVMRASLGDRIEAGQPLANIHVETRTEQGAEKLSQARRMVEAAVTLSDAPPEALPPLVYAVVRPDGVERF